MEGCTKKKTVKEYPVATNDDNYDEADDSEEEEEGISTFSLSTRSPEKGFRTCYMVLAELGDDIVKLQSQQCSLTQLKILIELDMTLQNGEDIVRDILKNGTVNEVKIGQPSDLTLSLNGGLDVLTQLWYYYTCSGCNYENCEDLMLAFIEMGALDLQHAPSNIYEKIFPDSFGGYSKFVHACPVVFRDHHYFPVKECNSEFITNVVIRGGIDFNTLQSAKTGKTILMGACSLLCVEGVQLLLAAGADVNKQDANNATCLHYVAFALEQMKKSQQADCLAKARDIVAMLKEARVDCTIRTQDRKQSAQEMLKQFS